MNAQRITGVLLAALLASCARSGEATMVTGPGDEPTLTISASTRSFLKLEVTGNTSCAWEEVRFSSESTTTAVVRAAPWAVKVSGSNPSAWHAFVVDKCGDLFPVGHTVVE